MLALHQALAPIPPPTESACGGQKLSGVAEDSLERADHDDGWLEVGGWLPGRYVFMKKSLPGVVHFLLDGRS